MSYITIDVDVEDIYDNMDGDQCTDMAQELFENDYVPEEFYALNELHKHDRSAFDVLVELANEMDEDLLQKLQELTL